MSLREDIEDAVLEALERGIPLPEDFEVLVPAACFTHPDVMDVLDLKVAGVRVLLVSEDAGKISTENA